MNQLAYPDEAARPAFAGERMLRRTEVCARLGIHPTTLWRMIAREDWPAPITLGASHLQRWPESVVDQAIERLRLSDETAA